VVRQEPVSSTVFDRVADVYDVTRGGDARGREVAAQLVARLVPGAPVLDIGVGTGVVAAALLELGVAVAGIDLSLPMLERAALRLPGRVARADAMVLPVADSSLHVAVSVWVLHLVGDPGVVFAEVARVLRPGGRYLVVLSDAQVEGSDVEDLTRAATLALRGGAPKQDDPAGLVPLATAAGLTLVEHVRYEAPVTTRSPRAEADVVEKGVFSWLWNVTPQQRSEIIDPLIAALRALPDPERPRPTVLRPSLLVFSRD
jgi:SAM-dependent methyltransferase